MIQATQVLDQSFLEMRWRCLSLAADLDRVQRADNGDQVILSDPRLINLRKAFESLLSNAPNRAELVQMIFSDMTPPPR
jgi:hypothetical protein